jgi:diguanylate cyclase (GGDEF)-like protein/PAS domain S-box-containing protein
MKDKEKTKEQLIDELAILRQQITELQKSEIKHQLIEKTLGENEEKYRILVELAADGVLIETVEGCVLECNAAGAKMFGYTKEEIISLTIADLVPEEFAKKLPKIITDKETTYGIFLPRISKKKDGTIFPTEIASKIINIGGKPRLIVYVRDITKSKEAEKKLKKTRKMFASLFASSPEAALYHDENGRIININPHFTKIFGYTLKEIRGRNINEGMIYPENKIREGKILTQKAFNGFSDHETIRKKKDGTLVPVIISTAPVIIDKKTKGTIALYRDITERKKAEEELRDSEERLKILFDYAPDAYYINDLKGNFIDGNIAAERLIGYKREELIGKSFLKLKLLSIGDIPKAAKLLAKNLMRLPTGPDEFVLNRKDNTKVTVEISTYPVKIKGKTLTLGIARDITERKKMEGELEKLAHFDNLTGCYSRGYGLALLEEQIKTANRKKNPILLLYLDVDKFKEINDTYGHKEGDRLLKEVVQLFKSTPREVDIICRMGGDEFLLIFPDSSLDDAPLIRKRLSKNLEKLNQKLAKPYKIDFSIGLSYYNPSTPLSIEELIRIADENMYKDKSKKKK